MTTLPATTQIPGLSVMTEGVYTIVTIKDEILVKFESNNFLVIKIPATSNGKVRRLWAGGGFGVWKGIPFLTYRRFIP